MSRAAQHIRQNPLLLGAVIIVLVAGLGVAWWLGSPLFINNTVNETFPISAPQAAEQSAQPICKQLPAARRFLYLQAASEMPTHFIKAVVKPIFTK